MRKYFKILVILLVCYFGFSYNVFASTNTFERSEDNLLVPEYVEVTENNKSIILKTPAVDASEKIYDFADLYSDQEESKLYYEVNEFISQYDMDLVVVTIDSNDKATPAAYSDDFYDYNEFGIGSGRDGLLFLIDMDNREIYMSTCGKAIAVYNDYRINTALDAVYTYMSSKDYYSGTSSFISLISNYASSGVSNNYEYEEVDEAIPWFTIFIISSIVTVIGMIILVRMNKMVRKAVSSKEYLVKDTMKILHVSERYLGSSVTKVRIQHDSSSSGGGSSTHISSSGSSHGGGGHKF